VNSIKKLRNRVLMKILKTWHLCNLMPQNDSKFREVKFILDIKFYGLLSNLSMERNSPKAI
jgi:hypothetical protein